MKDVEQLVQESLDALVALDVPAAQQNDRTARVLLALLNLNPRLEWAQATNPMLTIRGIADFIREKLEFDYAENSRESIRKYSVKQLVDAGVLLHNPDDPSRAVNSSKNCYQVEAHALKLFKQYGTDDWTTHLSDYSTERPSLAKRYAKERDMQRIPVKLSDGQLLTLSPGDHSELIKQIIDDFGGYFVPGADLVYVGDTGSKWGYFDENILKPLNIKIGNHGKMPDVVLYDRRRNWLVLVEATASTGPVDNIRHQELAELFSQSTAGLVYVTAFPDRGAVFRQFLAEVSWETEVWCASDPTHLIHFNGDRYLGPH